MSESNQPEARARVLAALQAAGPKGITTLPGCLECGQMVSPKEKPGRPEHKFCSPTCCTRWRWKQKFPTPADRFWSKVRKGSPSECWEWTRSIGTGGYGKFGIDGVIEGAHRMAWTITNGPIPEGLFVCHSCDNRKCCNPAHLWLGTIQDNLRDMVQKRRHQAGERHYRWRAK